MHAIDSAKDCPIFTTPDKGSSVHGRGFKCRESRVESSLGAEALNRNVGEAFEEFLKFTEGLKHQGSSGRRCSIFFFLLSMLFLFADCVLNPTCACSGTGVIATGAARTTQHA